jgi:hypothetical protein
LFIVAYEFWLVQVIVEASNRVLYHFLSLISKLSYSYIAAFVFYFVAVHLPKERRKSKLFLYLNNRFAGVHHDILYLFSNLDRIIGGDIKTQYLTTEELKGILNGHDASAPLMSSGFDNFHAYFKWQWNKTRQTIDEILVFNDLLNPTVLNYLSLIESRFERFNPNQRQIGNDLSSYVFFLDDLGFYINQLTDVSRNALVKPYRFRYHNDVKKEYKKADAWRQEQKAKEASKNEKK